MPGHRLGSCAGSIQAGKVPLEGAIGFQGVTGVGVDLDSGSPRLGVHSTVTWASSTMRS
jgi:hypothetical protein